jgi:hypothetical protein
MSLFVVQRFNGADTVTSRRTWVDMDTVDAVDAGAALQQVFSHPGHRIQATTYRVAEEALTVNVSINLETVEP